MRWIVDSRRPNDGEDVELYDSTLTGTFNSTVDDRRRWFVAWASVQLRGDVASTDLAVTRALDLAEELEKRGLAPWQT